MEDDTAKKSGCCRWRGDNEEVGRPIVAAAGEEEEKKRGLGGLTC